VQSIVSYIVYVDTGLFRRIGVRLGIATASATVPGDGAVNIEDIRAGRWLAWQMVLLRAAVNLDHSGFTATTLLILLRLLLSSKLRTAK
jgi:hypothetical protein